MEDVQQMKDFWNRVDTEDGREILFAWHKIADINEGYKKMADVIRIINENNIADESQISLTSDSMTIVLHGHSKEPITQKDWNIARQIETSLKH